MKRSLITSLQVLVVLLGIGILVFMLWEPHLEGRNVHATNFEIYFRDLFLAYVYVASTTFFIALYKTFTLLGRIKKGEIYSEYSLHALKMIKYSARTIIIFILGAEAYAFVFVRGRDDIAGGVAVGFFLLLVSITVAFLSAKFEKIVQQGDKIGTCRSHT